MRAWTVTELHNLVQTLQPLVGTRLQEVQTQDNDVLLGFFGPEGLLWLWMDLHPVRPCVLPWMRLPFKCKNVKSPLNLFLRAHFVGRQLLTIHADPSEGRVLHLEFSSADANVANLEVRLFPHGRNVIARASGKKVAWQKIADLPSPGKDEMSVKFPTRSLDDLREQWKVSRGHKAKAGGKGEASGAADPLARLKKEIERKEKALAKVNEELERKKAQPWREIGDALKLTQSVQVKKEWEPFIDKRRKLSWNIDQAYQKARELESKQKGTLERVRKLEAELEQLRTALAKGQPLSPTHEAPRSAAPIKDLNAQTRTLRMNGEMTLMAGKNAEDNLQLLRKARSWDLWLHLRDFPSRHAILFKNKSTPVSEAQLNEAAEWLVKQHFGQKLAQHAGERIQVLIAECRFVRPIKGDRIGRVTYQNERVLIHQIAK